MIKDGANEPLESGPIMNLVTSACQSALKAKVKSQSQTSMLMLNVRCELPCQYDPDCPPLWLLFLSIKVTSLAGTFSKRQLPPVWSKT